MIPRGGTGAVVSIPPQLDRSVVVVTGTTLHDRRTAYRLEEECGARLRAWIMLERSPDPGDGSGATAGPRGRGGLRRHLRLGPGHLVRLARSLPRRMREQRALRRWPRAVAGAERRLLAEEVDAHPHRATLSPRRLSDPAGPALEDALRTENAGVVVAASPGLLPPEFAARWKGPILTVYPGWSPTVRGNAPVEQALYRRSLDELGATVHLLTDAGELGPMLRRSHPCLVPWDTPESARQRVLALGTELLCEVVRELVERGEIVAYAPPIESHAPRVSRVDGRLLATLQEDHRRGWISAALRDARRF
jgi:folate-dependent phosphoribosylglycinamide formyltransferase PurN